MLELVAIKTKDNYLFANVEKLAGGYHTHNLHNFLFDGKKIGSHILPDWYVIDSPPQKISRIITGKEVNKRFELQDKDLESEKIPAVLNIGEEIEWDDSEYEYVWTPEYYKYQSLYKLVWDMERDIEEEIPFSFKVLFEVDEIRKPEFIKGLKGDVNYPLIEKLLYPNILLSTRPCYLSSKQTYDIVRAYVKENINPKYARITSDYNFCFQVEKVVKLSIPQKYTVDVNAWKPRAKPKYETLTKEERLYTCFEMTNKEDNYKGYTPIDGFTADNQEELNKKITEYCEDLIAFINEPMEDCPHCQGRGVILQEKFRVQK